MSTDDLEDRLRRLGQTPIAPEVAIAHRHAIAQAGTRAPRARFGWKAVALASVVGFFAGSTALAAAGSLPAPAQDVAHDTLGAVGIDVPRSSEDCPEGASYRNHGEYVASVEAAGGDVGAAARSRCGKPAHPGKGNGKGPGDVPGTGPDRDGDPCTGPPPWAGTHLDAEAKAAARAEHEAACGPDDDDGSGEDRAPDDDAEVTTTSAEAETTTTSTEAQTTTTTLP